MLLIRRGVGIILVPRRRSADQRRLHDRVRAFQDTRLAPARLRRQQSLGDGAGIGEQRRRELVERRARGQNLGQRPGRNVLGRAVERRRAAQVKVQALLAPALVVVGGEDLVIAFAQRRELARRAERLREGHEAQLVELLDLLRRGERHVTYVALFWAVTAVRYVA